MGGGCKMERKVGIKKVISFIGNGNSIASTSVESWNKTLHIEAWDDPIEPIDKIPLLPY